MSAVVEREIVTQENTHVTPFLKEPFFSPMTVLQTPFLHAERPTGKITPEGSLDIVDVRQKMEEFTKLTYGHDLMLTDVTSENLHTGRGVIVNPIARWFKGAVMWMSVADRPAMSLDSVPDEEQKMVWELHADALDIAQLDNPGLPVMMGACNSAGGLDKPMSVLAAHTQFGALPEQFRNLQISDVVTWRSEQHGDGVSQFIGVEMGDIYRRVIPSFGYSIDSVGHDNLGSYVVLDGVTPLDIAEERFSKLWKILSLAEHSFLKEYHAKLYGSDLDEVISMVQVDARAAGGLDKTAYAEKFVERMPDDEDIESDPIRRLRALKHHSRYGNMLRQTFGWSGNLLFIGNKLLITQNPALIKQLDAGAMENIGIKPDRVPNPVDKIEMAEINENFDQFSQKLKARQQQRRLRREPLQLYGL